MYCRLPLEIPVTRSVIHYGITASSTAAAEEISRHKSQMLLLRILLPASGKKKKDFCHRKKKDGQICSSDIGNAGIREICFTVNICHQICHQGLMPVRAFGAEDEMEGWGMVGGGGGE